MPSLVETTENEAFSLKLITIMPGNSLRVVVDQHEATLVEAGDLLQPLAVGRYSIFLCRA